MVLLCRLLFAICALAACVTLLAAAEPPSLPFFLHGQAQVAASTGIASASEEMRPGLERRVTEQGVEPGKYDEDILCASWSANCRGCFLATSVEYNGRTILVDCKWVAAGAENGAFDNSRCVSAAGWPAMPGGSFGEEHAWEDECSELPWWIIFFSALGFALVVICVFCLICALLYKTSAKVVDCREEDEDEEEAEEDEEVVDEPSQKTDIEDTTLADAVKKLLMLNAPPPLPLHPPPPCLALMQPEPPEMLPLAPAPPTEQPALLGTYAEADQRAKEQRVLCARRPSSAPPSRSHQVGDQQCSAARPLSASQRRESTPPCMQQTWSQQASRSQDAAHRACGETPSAPAGQQRNVRPSSAPYRQNTCAARQNRLQRPDAAQQIQAVRQVLVEAADLPIVSRRAVLRRLQLRWHPDKNDDDDQVTATAVLQYINANSRWFLGDRELG